MTHDSQAQILVVEDNGALRRLMVRILEGCGYSVLAAPSGPAGLELFRQHSASVDLAIVDMVMPGMSGLDLAAEIGRCRPGTKILYITGHTSSVAIESISQRSPDHVLLKPFDASELIGRVVHLLKPDEPQPTAAPPPKVPA